MRCKVIAILCIAFHAALSWGAEVFEAHRTQRVIFLQPGSVIDYQPVVRHRGFFENDLRTYCYMGVNKTLKRIFESVELQLEINGDDYTQYEGSTPAEVREHYDENRSLFSFSLFLQKRTRLQLSPFVQQCIGIETVQPYKLRLHQVRVDFWRVLQLALGIILFSYAGSLSKNSLFYYITGITLGICSSFMLLIWLSSKLVPRRTMMYGVLIGGWTIGIYVLQMLWENLQMIVLTYRTYVFWYILTTGIVSFFFCYRLGPPKDQRSKNIVKWLLQLMSLALIYFSNHFEEATAAIIIMTIVLHYFPRSFMHRMRALYLRRFPPKRRFLTNEEYYEEGVRETTKALAELRAYARSPDCKQWRVMTKLHDPLRFASFVEGASHLCDEEILQFEYSKYGDELNESESEASVNEEDDFNNVKQEEASYSNTYRQQFDRSYNGDQYRYLCPNSQQHVRSAYKRNENGGGGDYNRNHSYSTSYKLNNNSRRYDTSSNSIISPSVVTRQNTQRHIITSYEYSGDSGDDC